MCPKKTLSYDDQVRIVADPGQFAASTGWNRFGRGTSFFDAPPKSYKGLEITAAADDKDPYSFSTGERYDLSYHGPDGAVSLTNAKVIRSDRLDGGEGNQGVVVFQGTMRGKGVVEVVYSPNHDLQKWYDSATANGQRAAFYDTDQSPGDFGFVCFAAGTRVAAPGGGRAVEQMRAGDLVRTADHGAQPILWVGIREVEGHEHAAPVVFDTGIVGNRAPLVVSQQHRILLHGARVARHAGTPEVLVPAKALVNGSSIRIAPRDRVTYVHLLFRQHEILRANGAPCESLFAGSMAFRQIGDDLPDEVAELFPVPDGALGTDAPRMRPARPLLTVRQGRRLAGRLGLVGAEDVDRLPAPPSPAARGGDRASARVAGASGLL